MKRILLFVLFLSFAGRLHPQSASPTVGQLLFSPPHVSFAVYQKQVQAQRIIARGWITTGEVLVTPADVWNLVPFETQRRLLQAGWAREQAQADRVKATNDAVQAAWRKKWDDGKAHATQSQEKALLFNIDLAMKGDDYGQYRMAQRLRDGDGVIQDFVLSKWWFQRSATQTNRAAQAELEALLQAHPEIMSLSPATTNFILKQSPP